jgi:hypothetical protein
MFGRGGISANVSGTWPNSRCMRAGNHQRDVACAPNSPRASTMAHVQVRGQGLPVCDSATTPPPSLRGLGSQFRFSPGAQFLEMPALSLPALALLGREELLVFLRQELADALVHATFVLPAAILLARAPQHDSGEDKPAHPEADEDHWHQDPDGLRHCHSSRAVPTLACLEYGRANVPAAVCYG